LNKYLILFFYKEKFKNKKIKSYNSQEYLEMINLMMNNNNKKFLPI